MPNVCIAVMWDLVLLGLIVTLEPLPIIGFILLLSTAGGTAKGAAFIGAWLVCLIAIVVVTLALTGGHPPRPRTVPGRGVSVVTLLLGIGLVGIAVRQRRRSRQGAQRPISTPKWVSKLDTMPLWAAAGLGVALQPWPLVAAGAALITEADVSSASSFIYLVLFCGLSTSSLFGMEGYVLIDHDEATVKLAGLRVWLSTHRERGIGVLALVAGITLLTKGAYQLAQ